MNPIRKLARNLIVSRTILGMWVLWSGMLLCLLTPPAEASDARDHGMAVEHMDAATMLSHCLEVDEETDTLSCNAEISGPIVPTDILKLATVHMDALYGVIGTVADRTTPVLSLPEPASLCIRDLFLVFCSFLK